MLGNDLAQLNSARALTITLFCDPATIPDNSTDSVSFLGRRGHQDHFRCALSSTLGHWLRAPALQVV
jgi:hypothetical protein